MSLERESAAQSTDDEAFIPGGKYTIGPYDFCLKLNRETGRLEGPGKDCKKGFMPAKEVKLSPYFIERTEVTVVQYETCVRAKACPRITDKMLKENNTSCGTLEAVRKRFPDGAMSCVNHSEAEAYCKWKGKRLPTDAEWEVAGRGGDSRMFPWGDDFPKSDVDTFTTFCRAGQPCPVRRFGPFGPFKLFGMESGVREWTSSPGCESYPIDCNSKQFGVRGGAFMDYRNADWAIPSVGGSEEYWRFIDVGFRCARSAPEHL